MGGKNNQWACYLNLKVERVYQCIFIHARRTNDRNQMDARKKIKRNAYCQLVRLNKKKRRKKTTLYYYIWQYSVQYWPFESICRCSWCMESRFIPATTTTIWKKDHSFSAPKKANTNKNVPQKNKMKLANVKASTHNQKPEIKKQTQQITNEINIKRNNQILPEQQINVQT